MLLYGRGRVEKLKGFRPMSMFLLIVGTCIAELVHAVEGPPPIGAEVAFDAYAKQIDPETGIGMSVALVDVRSRAEFVWVGAPTQVKKIILKSGKKFQLDYGKVILNAKSKNDDDTDYDDNKGDFLSFTVRGKKEATTG